MDVETGRLLPDKQHTSAWVLLKRNVTPKRVCCGICVLVLIGITALVCQAFSIGKQILDKDPNLLVGQVSGTTFRHLLLGFPGTQWPKKSSAPQQWQHP